MLAEQTPGEMLIAIPGAELEQAVASLRKTADANASMEDYYSTKKATFATAG